MILVDATNQVELIRKYCPGYAVQSMHIPGYLKKLLYHGPQENVDYIILVYKPKNDLPTDSLPIEFSSMKIDNYYNLDVTGNPLECPFDDDEFEYTIQEKITYNWSKAELNQLPVAINDARKLMLKISKNAAEFNNKESSTLDIWILSNETNQNLEKNVLLGITPLKDDKWWIRHTVISQPSCLLESSEMDPKLMKKEHIKIAQMPDALVKSNILCQYTISTQESSKDLDFTSNQIESANNVKLEVQWNQLTNIVPASESVSTVAVQVLIGNLSCPTYELWEQLKLLQSLVDLMRDCWHRKVSPQEMPHNTYKASSALGETFKDKILFLLTNSNQSLVSKVLQEHRRSSSIGTSQASSVQKLAGHKNASDFSEIESCSILSFLSNSISGVRENGDITDQLWILLTQCKTYTELSECWEFLFEEINKGALKPDLSPQNTTRAASLIKELISSKPNLQTELWQMEGVLTPLELLIEIGMEKLSADYKYIFLKSELVGVDSLQMPQKPRSGLGWPREAWFSSCGQLLQWLGQMHTSLEVLLSLSQSFPKNILSTLVSRVLSYYQSDESPVTSVLGLLSETGNLQIFRTQVYTKLLLDEIKLPKDFDWWRLTLTSEDESRKVRNVFLRSRNPIFPPQISDDDSQALRGNELDVLYFAARATTFSDHLSCLSLS